MLAWIDLETTGLNPSKEAVLEVACVVTDDDLEVLGTFSEVIHHPIALEFARYEPEDIGRMDVLSLAHVTGVHHAVIEMHIRNGLWRASAIANPGEANYVDSALAGFIDGYTKHIGPPQLAGSTISFDRSFIEIHFPDTNRVLHYRNLDVTTLNEMARRNWRGTHDARPRGESNHRALDDIKASIETYSYYVNTFNAWRKGELSPAAKVVS